MLAVIEQADESRKPDRVREQNAFVVGIVRRFSYPVEEIYPDIELLFRQLNFPHKRVGMPYQRLHDRRQSCVRRSFHRFEDRIGNLGLAVNDHGRTSPRRRSYAIDCVKPIYAIDCVKSRALAAGVGVAALPMDRLGSKYWFNRVFCAARYAAASSSPER